MPDQTDLARNALLEITRADTIGPLVSQTDDGAGLSTMLFEARMSGYPGWHWNVSVATVEGEEPTVLEAELLPGDGALLAPDWVPWADRMDEWRAAQAAAEEAAGDLDDDDLDDDDLEDEDDGDFDDEDVNDDDEALLHSGDLDGVDIDSFDDEDADLDAVDLEADEIQAGETGVVDVTADDDDEPDADDAEAEISGSVEPADVDTDGPEGK